MIKRSFDIFVSLAGLILLAPLLLFIALLIIVDSPGSVLFVQRRVGKDRVPFRILKFRTMRKDAERNGRLTVGERDPRVTRIGYWLRRSKLDELPQLINVIKGDMSLVGPRPEVEEFVARYDKRQLEVLKVRPGITDQASVEFANESDYLSRFTDAEAAYTKEVLPKKLQLNLEYIQNQSFWSDITIILRTLFRLTGEEKKH